MEPRMSNLVQKVPQIVSVSSASATEKKQDGKVTVSPAPKMARVLLPRPAPASTASSLTLGKTAGAGSWASTSGEPWSRTSWPSNTVVPIKLWRNPNAVLNDAPTLPLSVMPSCSSQSTARQPELKRVIEVSTHKLATPLRTDESVTKATSDAVLVVKKTQSGRTIIATQGVLGSGIKPPQCLVTHASGSSTPAVTSDGAFHQNVIPTLSDRGMVRVAVNPSEPGSRGARIVFQEQTKVGVPLTKLRNSAKDGSCVATTEMGNTTSSSLQGKHSPAVVHVGSSTPCRNTVRKLLENTCTVSKPITNNAPPSSQSVVSVLAKPTNTGVPVLKKGQSDNWPPRVVQPRASQEQEDDSYGFKIVSVCSLAKENESQNLPKQVPQVGNDGGNTNKATTSNKTRETSQEKDGSPEKGPELKETMGSKCNPHTKENEGGNDVIELCSFQTKRGNSVIGSQIVFKPAPSAGHVSTNAMPSSKSGKFKAAMKLLEQSMLQDKDLFSEGEKNILTSLFRRVKNETLTAGSEAGESCQDKLPLCPKVVKMEPASPDRHTNDSVFNAQQDETLENLTTQCRNEPLQSPVVIKAEPTSPEQSEGDSVPDARQEDLASQAPKGEHGAAAPNKAVRRIVITSDELPVFTSDQIKAGIEAFLIENNIPNNFSKDEVIKLHWDGRNLSTFHFRDMNSNRSPSPHPPPDVPVPQKIKPNILRGNKLPNASAGIEPSDTATVTVLAGGQTGSGTTPPKVNTLPERSKVSTSEPAMPCGYRAIRVKCVADSDKVVVAPLGPVSTTRDNISAEKQLCFMPRAIRYINKTGEVIEKPLNPRQQVLPFVPPVGTKVAPIQKSATSSSPAVPVVSSDSLQQTTAKLIQTKPAKPMPIVAERPSVPVTVSRVVRVNAESHNPKPRGLDASLPQGLVGSVNMPQAPLQRPAYSTVCDDDTTRILEPEVLLKVSNKVIQVQPLKAGLDTSSSSSSSSTSSCCSEDWAPTTQMHRKQRGRKRAAPRSSIQREYRSRKRRRRVKKENSPAPQLDAKPSKSPSDEMNVNILSSNCIDRPCVVSMYHLNDRLMTKGFVNLASIKHKELFALARTPEVRLAPGKVVSVVKLNPCKTESPEEVAITHVSESLPREMETDSLESLLREQMNHLVHLRKKYKQSGP